MNMAQKVLIIPDSFKDSISSIEFCAIAKDAILKISPQTHIQTIPMAEVERGALMCLGI